jgi:2-polyprenyl-3-methyl-5-hydroxy-6-metoxy-1,4-benzoquinol methylase
VRCRDCRTLFDAGPRPGEGHATGDDHVTERPVTATQIERVLAHLERYVKPGRLLDLGAGGGPCLSVAQRRGWDAVALAVGSLADPLVGEPFDAVTLIDVIEHVVDVDAVLGEVSRRVRPGGALVVLTPDAGAPASRTLGRRWSEVVPGESSALYSVAGLSAALRRHGFVASGWHAIGKHRTKLCLYARRLPTGQASPEHRAPRIPQRPEQLAQVDEAILGELSSMAESRRLCQWAFDTFADHVEGARVLEVGAGIGTFTGRMLAAGAKEVLAMEPEPVCADVLDETFAGDPRVLVTRDGLPQAPSLEGREGTFDLVVCQNVLEHIGDDLGALEAMRRALRPGGRLSLLVPAGPRLFGALDDAYGHWRRYDEPGLRALLVRAGFSIDEMYSHNALGILGWWAKNRRPGARVDATSLKVYEVLVGMWRPIEERTSRRIGLSLVCTAVSP